MSLKKIAEMTGLSVATVSHVINGTRSVSDKSRKLVQDAIEKSGYRPNRAARMLKTQKSDTVALVIPSVKPGRSTNFFFMNVISGAKDALEAEGYDLIVSTYNEGSEADSQAEVAILDKNWVDGMLIVPGDMQSSAVTRIANGVVPFVLIDRTVDNAAYTCVHSDNYAATAQAIRLFYSCGKRRIGFLGGMIRYSTGYDRYRSYLDTLAQLNLPYDENIVCHNVEYEPEAGFKACKKLVENGVDAIFTSNNILTIGVLGYLQTVNLAVPSQVGVIGYEDYEWMEIFSPPITTIRQQSYALGAVGAQLLLDKLAGRKEVQSQVLEASLIVRGSHG